VVTPVKLGRRARAVLRARRQRLDLPIASTFAGIDDDTWVWLQSSGARRFRSIRRLLPELPPPELQRQITAQAGQPNMWAGIRFVRLLNRFAAEQGQQLGELEILDFGCGWGRILRLLERDVAPWRMWGVDVSEDLVRISREVNPKIPVLWGKPLPPSPLAGSSFDLIYAQSVFSHLDEEAHRAWMDEFVRLLRPGGFVVLTTFSRNQILTAARKRAGGNVDFSAPGVHHAFPDTAAALAAFDAGQFCHSSTGHDTLAHYGSSCVPEKWVRENWPAALRISHYLDDRDIYPQNVLVAVKDV
jgi:SAM-dependent methyltransferase